MNHRLPTELKALRGTLNTTREKANPAADTTLKETSLILKASSVGCPKSITDKYCRQFWKKLTSGLLSIGVLSAADIPQIEQLCVCLQKLREVTQVYIGTSPFDEDFDELQKRWIALSNKFDQLGSKYYISPVARSKIRLDDLNIKKAEQEITKNESVIQQLLGSRT